MHKKTHTSIQVQRRQSGFPCAVVYGLLRALPGDRAFLPPSSLRNLFLKNLTPASGRQDHTALPYATRLRLSLRRAWYPSAETPAKAETAPFVRTLCVAERDYIACQTPPRPSHPAPRQ